jgi:hypothetical protein
LKPKLVIEICYDHFSGERFRHGTSILRWRPDKSPTQCTFDQLKQKAADPMKLLRSPIQPVASADASSGSPLRRAISAIAS